MCNLVTLKADLVGRRWEGKEGGCQQVNIEHQEAYISLPQILFEFNVTLGAERKEKYTWKQIYRMVLTLDILV